MDSKTNPLKNQQTETSSEQNTRKKLPEKIQAKCREYKRLIEEFEAINNNSAYDAVIHYLKSELSQLQALLPQNPEKQTKR